MIPHFTHDNLLKDTGLNSLLEGSKDLLVNSFLWSFCVKLFISVIISIVACFIGEYIEVIWHPWDPFFSTRKRQRYLIKYYI